MTAVEFANRQRDAAQTAWRDHRGDPAAVRQSRIEDGLRFRDVVAQATGNILDRDQEGSFPKRNTVDRFKESLLLDKHAVRAIDHDFADGVVKEQMLDWF